MSDVLLISPPLLKEITNISDNVSNDYLLPAINLAQDIELEETIGTPLLNKIKELIKDNQINNAEYVNYKYLLDKYIQNYLSYLVISHLAPTVAFKIANQGVIRTDNEKQHNVTANELDKVVNYYKHIANTYKKRLQMYLLANYNKFKELFEYKTIDDIRANLYSAAGCPINLGGARGKVTEMPALGYGLPNSTIDI